MTVVDLFQHVPECLTGAWLIPTCSTPYPETRAQYLKH